MLIWIDGTTVITLLAFTMWALSRYCPKRGS